MLRMGAYDSETRILKRLSSKTMPHCTGAQVQHRHSCYPARELSPFFRAATKVAYVQLGQFLGTPTRIRIATHCVIESQLYKKVRDVVTETRDS